MVVERNFVATLRGISKTDEGIRMIVLHLGNDYMIALMRLMSYCGVGRVRWLVGETRVCVKGSDITWLNYQCHWL
jgi:hypothetical protein